jgi:uncharacterized protein
MNSIVTEIERIVEDACARDSNVFGYGVWTHHIRPVARTGRRMAEQFDADPEIVEIAALLHDYAGIKDVKLYPEHHIHGPKEAEQILCALGYPETKIAAVKHCIAGHRASVPVPRRSAEAECLANADAVTHIEQVPSLLNFVFTRRCMSIDEGASWVRSKLQRTWQKLSPQIQETVRSKYEAALLTLTSMTANQGS